MKKTLGRILAVLLAMAMLIPMGGALASATEGYKVGDIIEYGTYPQTDVTKSLGGVCTALRLKVLKSDTAGSEIAVVSSESTIAIRDYVPKKTVDYRTTLTFTAEVTDPVAGAVIHWFVNGEDKGVGETYVAKDVSGSFTVQAKYVLNGNTLAESETESVNVRAGFAARIVAFTLAIVGKLAKIVQIFSRAK